MKDKKKIIIAISVILIAAIGFGTGFSVGKNQTAPEKQSTTLPTSSTTLPVSTSQESSTQTSETTTEVVKENEVIETDFYKITIPASWDGNYSYKVLTYSDDGSYSLYFRHDKSYAESSGGHLFTIELHSVTCNYAEKLQQFSPTPFDYLGTISVPGKDDYQVIVTYSSDCQYSDAYEEEYNAIINTLDNALITIRGTNGATYKPL